MALYKVTAYKGASELYTTAGSFEEAMARKDALLKDGWAEVKIIRDSWS